MEKLLEELMNTRIDDTEKIHEILEKIKNLG
jgi:hypothetical protein